MGDDTFGRSTLDNFAKQRVSLDHAAVDATLATGIASILVDGAGNNAIVIVNGANDALRPADVERAACCIQAARVCVCQLEVSPETSLAALRLARARGVITLFNPAPAMANLPVRPLRPPTMQL